MAPPTEAMLLSTFLLPPAPLPAILTLKAFTALFPASQQSSPQIKTLYRDLQLQRTRITDTVGHNIIAETKRGLIQTKLIVKARREDERQEQDDEIDVENALFGPSSNLPVSKPHNLKSILPEMEIAVEDMEDEVRRLEEEAEALLEGMRTGVGCLSDLRYGRLANGQLREQVLEGLERLEQACEKK